MLTARDREYRIAPFKESAESIFLLAIIILEIGRHVMSINRNVGSTSRFTLSTLRHGKDTP
jgi:hypothetical protein